MTVYYLNATDFGKEDNHLVVNMSGISLVMFHSQRCNHCRNFLPEFKRLPGSIVGINFGICSVDESNRVVVQMSQQSSTPIDAVPKFILYNNGLPYVEYTGQRRGQSIIAFLQDIVSRLDQKQPFATRPPRSRQAPSDGGVGPTRPPQNVPTPPQQRTDQSSSYKITPSTGVKEYETSYGRPYNTLNEQDFLEYENAYKQQMSGNRFGQK